MIKKFFTLLIFSAFFCMSCGSDKTGSDVTEVISVPETGTVSDINPIPTDLVEHSSFTMPVEWEMKVKEKTEYGFIGILPDNFGSFSSLNAGDELDVSFFRGADINWKSEVTYPDPEIGETVKVMIVFSKPDVMLKNGDKVYAGDVYKTDK